MGKDRFEQIVDMVWDAPSQRTFCGLLVAFLILAVLPLTLEPSDSASVASAPRLNVVEDSGPEASKVTRETVYKGRKIRLAAERGANGGWIGAAEFLDHPGARLVTDEAFPDQQDALSAALSKAMVEVDKERETRGKP